METTTLTSKQIIEDLNSGDPKKQMEILNKFLSTIFIKPFEVQQHLDLICKVKKKI